MRTRNCICRQGPDAFGTIERLLAARDRDLLKMREFGVKKLAEFRAIVPVPIPVPKPDPVRVNAELARVFWLEPRDVSSLVGG